MSSYGQYCPAAKALDILGDRWTLLIVRELLTGMAHFNDMERGLPGISRALLAARLRRLQRAGLLVKTSIASGRKTTEYRLTQAGADLLPVIDSLVAWGAKWAFDEPKQEDLDPVLLMWWMRNRVNSDLLPTPRAVAQFNFRSERTNRFWLVMAAEDVSICLTDPGYEVDVHVTADLAVYLQLWAGRISYADATREKGIQLEGMPQMVYAFPSWFAWSHSAEDVKAVRAQSAENNH